MTETPRFVLLCSLLLAAPACVGNAQSGLYRPPNNASGDATGTGSTTSNGNAVVGAGNVIVPGNAVRGATVPYFEYEAEAARTNGTVLSPNRTFGTIASESSGRSAVQLNATGQNVTFVTEYPTNSIVVRYVVPDSAAGGGQAATLGLYINGKRTTLNLTSRYAWTYGTADAQGTGSEAPGAGQAHHFYDEAHAMFAQVPAGTAITLQQDAQDNAAYYVIDLVDFEDVPAPLPQPEGSISVTDYGATPNDGTDDSAAFSKAIAAAQNQNKVLYIPPGTFDQPAYNASAAATPKINVSGVTIQGAGMWYSVIQGFGAQFEVTGNNNHFSDFAVFGDITYRDDTKGWQGFDGPAGTNSTMKNVWIEHETAGWWVGKGAFVGAVTQPLTNGLMVHGIRVRDTYADGINFADATANSVVEQSTFRNNGDDSVATWSYTADGPTPCTSNTFRFNTAQMSWRANCFAIYGGASNSIQDSVCADTTNYPGILLSTTFSAIAFSGTTTVERNTLTRAGGFHYNQEFGALRFFADTAPVSGVQATDIEITSPTYSGIHFGGAQQTSNVTLDGIKVTDYGTQGIWVSSEAVGMAQASNVVVAGNPNAGLKNDAPNNFTLQRGSGNAGW